MNCSSQAVETQNRPRDYREGGSVKGDMSDEGGFVKGNDAPFTGVAILDREAANGFPTGRSRGSGRRV
jgi:hypothetical protein